MKRSEIAHGIIRVTDRLPTIVIIFLLAAFGNARAGGTNNASSIRFLIPHGAGQSHSVGVFQTKPFSMIVAVPRAVDDRMVYEPSAKVRFHARIVQPRLKIEPTR
jgi:hypothetical protein